ncbi:bacteriohemerythrin [Clostridium sp.]|uniref:bacteriohemerythrin n=1 Tax=Clostridium sp. TaxID=1506 RepID=UPI002607EDFA|nr:bacteriohemerythrin [Clostridium sp.]
MFQWKDSYSVGIELIDNQHKHLFDLGNSALNLMKNDSYLSKPDDVILLVNDLIQYSKFHFSTEESYMLKVHYPMFNEHKSEHDNFIQKINETNLTALATNEYIHIKDLVHFLLNWILNHILEKDILISKQSS